MITQSIIIGLVIPALAGTAIAERGKIAAVAGVVLAALGCIMIWAIAEFNANKIKYGGEKQEDYKKGGTK